MTQTVLIRKIFCNILLTRLKLYRRQDLLKNMGLTLAYQVLPTVIAHPGPKPSIQWAFSYNKTLAYNNASGSHVKYVPRSLPERQWGGQKPERYKSNKEIQEEIAKFFKKFSASTNAATCKANMFSVRVLSNVFVIPVPHLERFVANGNLENHALHIHNV